MILRNNTNISSNFPLAIVCSVISPNNHSWQQKLLILYLNHSLISIFIHIDHYSIKVIAKEIQKTTLLIYQLNKARFILIPVLLFL